jgi:hypothetical protein
MVEANVVPVIGPILVSSRYPANDGPGRRNRQQLQGNILQEASSWLLANNVEKVFKGGRTKFSRAADTRRAQRREGTT